MGKCNSFMIFCRNYVDFSNMWFFFSKHYFTVTLLSTLGEIAHERFILYYAGLHNNSMSWTFFSSILLVFYFTRICIRLWLRTGIYTIDRLIQTAIDTGANWFIYVFRCMHLCCVHTDVYVSVICFMPMYFCVIIFA